jgi:hypothetical protein
MLADFIETYHTATIVSTQTTYLNLAVEKGAFRVDFIDKAEFRLKAGTQGILAIYSQHPLLLDHNEPRTSLYINSRPNNPQLLFEDIEQAVAQVSEGWRDLSFYLFRWNKAGAIVLAKNNIEQGSGILLDFAPASIVRAVVAACEKHGAATKFFGSLEIDLNSSHKDFKVLFIGSCYVIARKFLVRAL